MDVGRCAERKGATGWVAGMGLLLIAAAPLSSSSVPAARTVPLAPAVAQPATADACGPGFVGIALPEAAVTTDPAQVLCTHGEDAHPRTRAAGSARPQGTLPSTAPACVGDGTTGARVQVLYLHAKGTPDRRTRLAPDLRRWAGQVGWTVARSAERLGGSRTVRFATVPTRDGCRLDLRSVSLPASVLADFAATVRALAEAGWSESDRRYLLFVDRDDYCGIATAPRDDRHGARNRVEHATGYARVDRPCWGTGDQGYRSTAAHELVHTLGAVQASAPRATPGGHCTDEWDLLCYADDDQVKVTHRCVDGLGGTEHEGDHNDRLLDCGGDDYFHPHPPAGSYLARHWNVADSSYLRLDAAATPPADHDGTRDDTRGDTRGEADSDDATLVDSLHDTVVVRKAGHQPLWLGLRRWWDPRR